MPNNDTTVFKVHFHLKLRTHFHFYHATQQRTIAVDALHYSSCSFLDDLGFGKQLHGLVAMYWSTPVLVYNYVIL